MATGGVIEAEIWQSAVLMTDLKTGYLVLASPKRMFYAQIIGSIIGAFISSGIYKLFTTIYTIPSRRYEAPLAHLWISAATLAHAGTLPDAVWAFSLGAFLMSAIFAFLRIASPVWWPRELIPSGVGMSIGE